MANNSHTASANFLGSYPVAYNDCALSHVYPAECKLIEHFRRFNPRARGGRDKVRNNIERYWAGLEKSWNGYLVESVATVIKRACRFTWRGIAARSILVETVYEKGIKLHGKEKKNLKKTYVLIKPSLEGYQHQT